jgi:hypothetical protein
LGTTLPQWFYKCRFRANCRFLQWVDALSGLASAKINGGPLQNNSGLPQGLAGISAAS